MPCLDMALWTLNWSGQVQNEVVTLCWSIIIWTVSTIALDACKYSSFCYNQRFSIHMYEIRIHMLPIFFLELDPASDIVYTVFDGDQNGIVDLDRRTCSCRCFQLEQLPCAHAMITIHHRKHDVYEFCLYYYSSACWKATYAKSSSSPRWLGRP